MGEPKKMSEQNLRNFSINFGPQHPAAHGVLRLVLELDGEVVERVDPHIGLLHRGTEKLMEARTYMQNVPYFDRLDYCAPMNQEHAFCLAIEKMLEVQVPRRAQLIRVLYCEIGRLLSHLLNVTTQAMDVGALTPPVWGFEEREKLMVFYERASGARMHANYFRPGGVARDLPPKLIEDIGAWCDPFLKYATISKSCSSRTASSSSAMSTSPLSRRRNAGNGAFRVLSCAVPASPGTCAARSLMNATRRWNSTFPSASMAIAMTGRWFAWRKCANRSASSSNASRSCSMPPMQGPVLAPNNKITPPSRGQMKNSMEALIHHFKLFTEGFRVPAGEVYAAVEAPKGEFGVYLVADGTDKPYKCKIRAPGFAHLQAMDMMSRGPPARRRLGHPWRARYRVRGGRPVTVLESLRKNAALLMTGFGSAIVALLADAAVERASPCSSRNPISASCWAPLSSPLSSSSGTCATPTGSLSHERPPPRRKPARKLRVHA